MTTTTTRKPAARASKTAKPTSPAPATKKLTEPVSLPDAKDEQRAIEALAAAGWPGKIGHQVQEAALAIARAKTRLEASKAELEAAKVVAKAAGGTGLAAHDRARVATLSGDKAEVAALAAPTRPGTARQLVWWLTLLDQVEAIEAADDQVPASQ